MDTRLEGVVRLRAAWCQGERSDMSELSQGGALPFDPHESVPQEVIDWAIECFDRPGGPRDHELRLLMTDERMTEVWRTLRKYAARPEALGLFVGQAAGLKEISEIITDPAVARTPGQRRKYRESIQKHCRAIDQLLNGWADLYRPRECREKLAEAVKSFLGSESLEDDFSDAVEPWLIDSVPTKVAAQSAVRTHYISALSHEVHELFGRPLQLVVAITTNVVFELDEVVDDRDVRRIVKGVAF